MGSITIHDLGEPPKGALTRARQQSDAALPLASSRIWMSCQPGRCIHFANQ